jgi:hypothetical protein
MADYVTRIRTTEGDKQIDYNALANLPPSTSECTNALKGMAAGSSIRVDDVSPVEHTIKCKVHGKNLVPYPYEESTTVRGGLTFTDNGNGTISVKGTVTDDFAVFTLHNSLDLTPGKTYFVGNSRNIYFAYKDETGLTRYKYGDTFTWSKEYTFVRLYLQYSKGNIVDTIIEPMLCVSDTAVEYEPYMDPTTVTVIRYGKNLLPYPFADNTKTLNGVSFTDLGDGGIRIAGTATSEAYFVLSNNIDFGATVSAVSQSATNGTYTFSKQLYYNAVNKTLSITIPSGQGVWETIYPQVEYGTKASKYEEYSAHTYVPETDGTVKGVAALSPTITLFTNTENAIIECEYNLDINAAFAGWTGGGAPSRLSEATILADKWIGTASPYSQVVTIAGVTPNSQVDLTPSVEQLSIFYNKDLAFVTENVGGTVTVYAIGQKPVNDYTIQATITEVIV